MLRTYAIFAVTAAALLSIASVRAKDPPPAQISTAYGDAAQRIIGAVRAGNDGWRKLEVLCDDIGHRLSGSEELEKAIKWALAELKNSGLENVRAEPVMVPKWVRGDESLDLIEPRQTRLPMLGLGGSIGTPPEGITTEALVVPDVETLREMGPNGAKGKIVVFNRPMPPYHPESGSGYGRTVEYRAHGPRWAAEAGAVACLVRSVTARSMQTPHTGGTNYGDLSQEQRIPAAAITIEDAEMLARLHARGIPLRLTLKMGARDEGMAPSANVVGELRGRERPDEIVVISGHFDSWDVGHGAHDDGGPCVAAMEAVGLLKKLNLIPRRTIRVVLWTNEENGLRGAKQYVADHAAELEKHVAAIEADSGVFAPKGFSVQHADDDRQARAARQLADILTLLEPLGATRASAGWSGADISQLIPAGVPCLGLHVDGSTYFDYHHTHADTLDKVDSKDLDACIAAMAVTAYVLADMPGRLGE